MKKFEIIAIVVLVLIAVICIPIFIYQVVTSDTDVPVFSVDNSVDNTNSEEDNEDNNEVINSNNQSSNDSSDFFDITQPSENDVTEDEPEESTFFDITQTTEDSTNESTTPDDEFTTIIDEGNNSELEIDITDDSQEISTIDNNNDSSVTISYLTNEAATFPYYIKVNVAANTITVYSKDENGNYTIPHKAFICSTGTATPHSRCLCYTTKI